MITLMGGGVLAAILTALPMAPQENALDVLDGETLYEGGWLFALGYEIDTSRGLRDGRERVGDPLDQERMDRTATLATHYGLRYNLQLSAIFPYVVRDLDSGAGGLTGEGTGDATFVAKWRFHRYDEPGIALNLAAIGGVEAPTGESRKRDDGVRLPPSLQPGSGSWDPFIGVAVTHEPYRWRFNAAAFYKRNGGGADDFDAGDVFFAELAAGNRFWLEPYPGPFMRLDALLRYRHEGRSHQGGALVDDSGRSLATIGANWAFRPRPSLDFQLLMELPIFERVEGVQLREGWSVFFTFGYRI